MFHELHENVRVSYSYNTIYITVYPYIHMYVCTVRVVALSPLQPQLTVSGGRWPAGWRGRYVLPAEPGAVMTGVLALQ